MIRDAELDRLKTAQDNAFQRKQVAYQAQQKTWECLSSLKNDLNRAFEEKQRAYKAQDDSWKYVQGLQDRIGPRVNQLKDLQERAYQNMKSAFDNASSAHARRDGASAKSYATEGHSYKTESQGYVEERRRLVGELKIAQANHNSTKLAFNQAKERFAEIKRKYDRLKAEHERAKNDFKNAKADFDQTVKAFKSRLEFIKNEQKLHCEANRRLAEQAGVPYQYLNSFKIDNSPDGGLNFYFGGMGEPDGPGHGHIATDRYGEIKYDRKPFDPHGSQNYTYNDNPRFHCYGVDFGESLTYKGYNAIKESGVDSKTGRATIDVYYGGANGNPLGEGHGHDVFYQDNPSHPITVRSPRR